MKTQNGFTLLENKEDVRKWLNSQRVTRTIAKCGGKKKKLWWRKIKDLNYEQKTTPKHEYKLLN